MFEQRISKFKLIFVFVLFIYFGFKQTLRSDGKGLLIQFEFTLELLVYKSKLYKFDVINLHYTQLHYYCIAVYYIIINTINNNSTVVNINF